MSMWSQDQKNLATHDEASPFFFSSLFSIVQSTKYSLYTNTQMLKNVSEFIQHPNKSNPPDRNIFVSWKSIIQKNLQVSFKSKTN